MPKTVTCLWFDGQAEQAAEHYVSIFPDAEILSVTRYGPNMPLPEGTVLTAQFRLGDHEYVGLNGGPEYHFTEAISFQIMCADQDEVDHYWTGLTDGGEEGPCGWLKDKFGVSWQVVPTRMMELMQDADAGRAQRATQAMMGMRKLVIADLEKAADQLPV